jgi:hypothetical protein
LCRARPIDFCGKARQRVRLLAFTHQGGATNTDPVSANIGRDGGTIVSRRSTVKPAGRFVISEMGVFSTTYNASTRGMPLTAVAVCRISKPSYGNRPG